jgi:hypothetical protein
MTDVQMTDVQMNTNIRNFSFGENRGKNKCLIKKELQNE